MSSNTCCSVLLLRFPLLHSVPVTTRISSKKKTIEIQISIRTRTVIPSALFMELYPFEIIIIEIVSAQ